LPQTGTRRLLRWATRLLGVGLVALLVATQVRGRDEIVLVDGTRLEGRVQALGDGAFEVETEDGPSRRLAPAEVASRPQGGREVPHVTWGFWTLVGRLSRDAGTVGLVLLALLGLLAMTGWRWHLLLRAVGLPLRLARAVVLTFVGGFFNLVVPGATGGDVVKAWYAARETGAGAAAVLSVFVDRFVGLFGLVVFAAGVLLVAPEREGFGVARTLVGVVFACVVVGGAVVLSRPVRRALGLGHLVRRLPFQRLIAELRAAAGLYRHRPKALALSLALSLVNHAATAACCWQLAQVLGIRGVDLGSAMALVPLANLLSAIPVLPGGWGVGELAFAWFFGQVGVPATEAVGLSVVFRLCSLVVTVPGGLFWALLPAHPGKAQIEADVEAAESSIEAAADAALLDPTPHA
jgi:uncharacterized protein (TIRG00374 family)